MKTVPTDGALESTMQSISKVELIAATLVTTRRKRTVTPSAAANETSIAFVELMTGRSASRACSEVDSITLSAYAAVPGKKLSSSGSHATAIALVSLRKHETFSDMPCTIKRPRPGGDTWTCRALEVALDERPAPLVARTCASTCPPVTNTSAGSMAESCSTADGTPPVEVHDAQAVALEPTRARQTSNAADASLAVASRVTALVVIFGADSSQTKPDDMRGRRDTASHAEAEINE
eukprot:scaffold133332_cov78-Phaeocystis_antarctica.AAC.2